MGTACHVRGSPHILDRLQTKLGVKLGGTTRDKLFTLETVNVTSNCKGGTMSRIESRLSGFGGQGIILAAYILGKAAALYDHKHATMTQNYGPESRGGACRGQVIISDEPIGYPRLTRPNVVVTMLQEAYAKYSMDVAEDGLLLIDDDLVQPNDQKHQARLCRIPATRLAEEMRRKMVANIVMLGFLAALDHSVSAEALRRAVRESVPKRTEEFNLQAYDVAARTVKYIQRGEIINHAPFARVDPSRCNGCSDCARVCPFLAIEMQTRQGEVGKLAIVDSLLCTGCGACVSVCPVRAAQVTNATDEPMEAQIFSALGNKETKGQGHRITQSPNHLIT